MTHNVLQFDWEPLHGKRLHRSVGIDAQKIEEGATAYRAIVLYLEDCALHVSVSEDTDELVVTRLQAPYPILPSQSATEDIAFMKTYAGGELGWCWIGINYRGYKDSFTISFRDIEPQILFVGIASTIQAYLLQAQ